MTKEFAPKNEARLHWPANSIPEFLPFAVWHHMCERVTRVNEQRAEGTLHVSELVPVLTQLWRWNRAASRGVTHGRLALFVSVFVLTQLWGWNRAVNRWATSRELSLYVTVCTTQLWGWNRAVTRWATSRELSLYVTVCTDSALGLEQSSEQMSYKQITLVVCYCLYWLSSGSGTEQWTDELQAENSRCMLLFVLTQLWGWNRAVNRWATSRELSLYVTVCTDSALGLEQSSH